jgi:hypothetical protein
VAGANLKNKKLSNKDVDWIAGVFSLAISNEYIVLPLVVRINWP